MNEIPSLCIIVFVNGRTKKLYTFFLLFNAKMEHVDCKKYKFIFYKNVMYLRKCIKKKIHRIRSPIQWKNLQNEPSNKGKFITSRKIPFPFTPPN